jgi:hypothetical protein
MPTDGIEPSTIHCRLPVDRTYVRSS